MLVSWFQFKYFNSYHFFFETDTFCYNLYNICTYVFTVHIYFAIRFGREQIFALCMVYFLAELSYLRTCNFQRRIRSGTFFLTVTTGYLNELFIIEIFTKNLKLSLNWHPRHPLPTKQLFNNLKSVPFQIRIFCF